MAAEQEWNPELRELGQFIRLQRQLADLSLRQLSEVTHVSNAYLSQIERGLHQPSLRVLRSIATALNLSADTLLARAGVIPQPPMEHAEDRPLPADTEEAIRHDPELSDEERETLLSVYRNFRARRPPTA